MHWVALEARLTGDIYEGGSVHARLAEAGTEWFRADRSQLLPLLPTRKGRLYSQILIYAFARSNSYLELNPHPHPTPHPLPSLHQLTVYELIKRLI